MPRSPGYKDEYLHRSGSRRRRASGRLAASVAAISVVFHGLVLVVADTRVLGHSVLVSASKQKPDEPARGQAVGKPPSPSCEADVALATFASLIYCTTPLGDASVTRCASAGRTRYLLGRITCNAIEIPTEIALVEPRVLDQIEAEPLLELLTPEEQKQFEQQQTEAIEQKFQDAQKQLETLPAKANQVVETTQPDVEEDPEDAQYLAEYSSKVDRQTVARGSTEEMIERPQPRELTPRENPREAAIKEQPDEPQQASNPEAPTGPGQLSMRKPGQPQQTELPQEAKTPGIEGGSTDPITANGIKTARGNADVREQAREAGDTRTGEGGGGGGRPAVPNLRPTEDILERVAGGGSVDKLDNVESGDTTALNAKRWKYASFFNRMKRRVAQHWHPADVYRHRDPSGNVYGTKDRTTFVEVSLSPKGKIARIIVVQPSGIDFLDEEAVRAFQVAQPFPNPPRGLIDASSGLITFRFGFHFEINKPRGWKIFRQR